MKNKLLNKKQLFDLAVCAFGIQFASSLLMSNMSSIYKFMGAGGGALSYLWLAAPISGLIIQPLIGQLSDDTLTRYGKRRPYIFFWGVVAFICFCSLPLLSRLWMVAILFWGIGCSINGITEALRALIGDITSNQQKAEAFAWQTVFAGIGAAIAAIFPWWLQGISGNLFIFNFIPIGIQEAFVLGGVVLVICMLWTLRHIKEKPAKYIDILRLQHQRDRGNPIKRGRRFLRTIILNIKKSPKVIRDFLSVQLFTWVGIFGMWLYFTLAIAQNIYGLPPGADIINHPQYAVLLANSTVQVDIYLGIYQFVSVLYAVILPRIANSISPRLVHAFSLLIGSLGIITVGLAHDEISVILSMIAIGIMWGSIMTMPYAIITTGIPRGKMGIYLGIFNATITVPQILGGFFLGGIHSKIFHGHAAYSLIFAGALIFIAAVILMRQVQRQAR
jgi:maltose/moltooligosaccharide transporter